MYFLFHFTFNPHTRQRNQKDNASWDFCINKEEGMTGDTTLEVEIHVHVPHTYNHTPLPVPLSLHQVPNV